MMYTAKIATNSPTNVSHTFHANSDALARAEADRCLQEVRLRVDAQLDALIKWDGTPPTRLPIGW